MNEGMGGGVSRDINGIELKVYYCKKRVGTQNEHLIFYYLYDDKKKEGGCLFN